MGIDVVVIFAWELTLETWIDIVDVDCHCGLPLGIDVMDVN